MRAELKLYSDDGELLQTLTANPQEIELDAKYIEDGEISPNPYLPLRIPSSRLVHLAVILKNLVPQENRYGRDIMYLTRDEKKAPSWVSSGNIRAIGPNGETVYWDDDDMAGMFGHIEESYDMDPSTWVIERKWDRLPEKEWRPLQKPPESGNYYKPSGMDAPDD